MSKANDAFISYRRSDGDALAKELYRYLDENGLRVFFDVNELTTAELDGESFPDVLREGVRNSSAFVLIATPDAFAFREKEDWVLEEIKTALEMRSKSEDYKIITLMAEDFAKPSELPKELDGFDKFNQIAPGENQLKRVLAAVTKINRHNLWNAGQRWLENSRKEGGRFASLDIDRTIMPKAKKRGKAEKFEQMPINVSEQKKDEKGGTTQGEERSLLSALSSTSGNIYLIGQGGIGKTTALISIMNDAYDGKTYSETAQIPLFIELSRAPDTYGKLYESGESTFIRRAIYQQVCGYKSIKEVPQSGVDAVDELLKKETDSPEYILLLDGLNETSRVLLEEASGYAVITMIMREIEWIINNCPNVRVMLTSRTDETEIKHESITRLHLSGVDDDTIRTYLTARKLPKKRIEAAFTDKKLLETIRIPLFLTMYATLKNADEVSSQGEIFRVFFSERRDNLNTYNVQSRAEEVDENVRKAASASQKARINTKMQYFILDFILPEIAFEMEREGAFYYDITKITEIIDPVLTDVSETAVCGRYGKDLFSKYREGTRIHTASVAKSMIEKLGDDIIEVAENIIDCAVYSLAIMQQGQDGYGFMHHHIRDYFAAVRNVNFLRLAEYIFRRGEADIARECLAYLNEAIVSPSVRRFIFEYTGEFKNAPVRGSEDAISYPAIPASSDRELLSRSLDIFRDVFDGSSTRAVSNIITIIKEARGSLCAANLSRLDLTRTSIGDVPLGRGDGPIAELTGAKINDSTLIPLGRYGSVDSAEYSPDGRYILTASRSAGKAIVRDAKTFETVAVFGENVRSASYSPDGRYIVVERRQKAPQLWDGESFTLIQTLSEGYRQSSFSSTIIFSPDSKYAVVGSSNTGYIVWSLEGSEAAYCGRLGGVRGACCFCGNDKIIALSGNAAEIWNIVSKEKVGELCFDNENFRGISVSADNRQAALFGKSSVRVYDIGSGEKLFDYNGEANGEELDVSFSPDNKIFLLKITDHKNAMGSTLSINAADSIIEVYDTSTYQKPHILSITEKTRSHRRTRSLPLDLISISKDGKYIAAVSNSTLLSTTSKIYIWDTDTFCVYRTYSRSDADLNSAQLKSVASTRIKNALFSSDSKYLFVSYGDRLYLIDIEKCIPANWMDVVDSRIDDFSFDDKNRLVFHSSGSSILRAVDIEHLTNLALRDINPDYFSGITCIPGKTRILAEISHPKVVRNGKLLSGRKPDHVVLDANNLKTVSENEFQFSEIKRFIRKADKLFMISDDYKNACISVYVPETHSAEEKLRTEGISDIDISDDCSKALIISGNFSSVVGNLEVWSVDTWELLKSFDGHYSSAHFGNGGKNFAAILVSTDEKGNTVRTLSVYDSETFSEIHRFDEDARAFAYSPDGSALAAVINDNSNGCKISIFSVDDFSLVASANHNIRVIPSEIKYSPDGKRIAAFGGGTTVKSGAVFIFDTQTLKQVGSADSEIKSVKDIEFTTDGKYLITRPDSSSIAIYNMSDLSLKGVIHNYPDLLPVGVDLRRLHPDSILSDDSKTTLRLYGAKVD